MDPRIQYAKTSDGVSIAYHTVGDGMPIVHLMNTLFSHLQLEWGLPAIRRWYERLSQQRRLVRYDSRGSGLSDRDVSDVSLEAHVRDLEAVVDDLGLERFVLFGAWLSGAVAVTYAVRHPDRVSHLVLWHAFPRYADFAQLPLTQGLMAVQDWDTLSETLAQLLLGWSQAEHERRHVALIRESVTREALGTLLAAFRDVDVTDLLPEISRPTLVLQRREVRFPTVDGARGLASRIPKARLALLEGRPGPPFLGDIEAVAAALDEFLDEGTARKTEPSEQGHVHTILFTDITSSTALTQRLGDARAQERVRVHNAIVREALAEHGGREIKHTGDGIMASFPTASGALECAIAIQRAIAERADPHLEVHIGLNAGEPIAEEADLFGTAVQLARRICDQAAGGEILASNVVRELAAGKGFLFTDRGGAVLRGFEEPVRLFEVRWRKAE